MSIDRPDPVQDLDRLRDDLRSDPVTGNQCNLKIHTAFVSFHVQLISIVSYFFLYFKPYNRFSLSPSIRERNFWHNILL